MPKLMTDQELFDALLTNGVSVVTFSNNPHTWKVYAGLGGTKSNNPNLERLKLTRSDNPYGAELTVSNIGTAYVSSAEVPVMVMIDPAKSGDPVQAALLYKPGHVYTQNGGPILGGYTDLGTITSWNSGTPVCDPGLVFAANGTCVPQKPPAPKRLQSPLRAGVGAVPGPGTPNHNIGHALRAPSFGTGDVMEREIEIGRGADLMSVCKAFGVGSAGLEELTHLNLDRLRRTSLGVGSFSVDVAEGDTVRIPASWPKLKSAVLNQAGAVDGPRPTAGAVGTVWDPNAIENQLAALLQQAFPQGTPPAPPGFTSPGMDWINAVTKAASTWFNQTNPGAAPTLDQARAYLQGAIAWLAAYGPGGPTQWPVDPNIALAGYAAAVQSALGAFTSVFANPPPGVAPITPPPGGDPAAWLSNVQKTAATWWALVQQSLPNPLPKPLDTSTAYQWLQAAAAFVKSYVPGVPGPIFPTEKGGATTPVTTTPPPPKTLDCGDPKSFHFEQGANGGAGGCVPNTGVATVVTPPAPVPVTPAKTIVGTNTSAPAKSNTGLILGVLGVLGLGAILLSTMGGSHAAPPQAATPRRALGRGRSSSRSAAY
jgi:hypothetical protein